MILQTDDSLTDVLGNENVSEAFDFLVVHCLPETFLGSLSVATLVREFT